MEKLLVTSNFSFSHSVFNRLVFKKGLFPRGSKGVIVWEWVKGILLCSAPSWSTVSQIVPCFTNYKWRELHRNIVERAEHVGNLLFRNTCNLEQPKLLWWGKKFNSFPSKPWFLRVCSTSPMKTLWQKRKLLAMSKCCLSCWKTFCHFHKI